MQPEKYTPTESEQLFLIKEKRSLHMNVKSSLDDAHFLPLLAVMGKFTSLHLAGQANQYFGASTSKQALFTCESSNCKTTCTFPGKVLLLSHSKLPLLDAINPTTQVFPTLITPFPHHTTVLLVPALHWRGALVKPLCSFSFQPASKRSLGNKSQHEALPLPFDSELSFRPSIMSAPNDYL